MVELLEREKTLTVKICMGNSCFSGNTINRDFIESYVRKHGLDAKIEICGLGCSRECNRGPNVVINEENIDAASPVRLESVLKKYI